MIYLPIRFLGLGMNLSFKSKENNMKFNVIRTSYHHHEMKGDVKLIKDSSDESYERSVWEAEINSIEDLLKLKEANKVEIIIKESWHEEGSHPYTIEIYDDYRE